MIKSDFHIHTVFSDGKNTPEEMVLAALERGYTALGFSDHSYVETQSDYSLKEGGAPAYRAAIRALQEKYRGKIEILCGIEQDYYSKEPTDEYDYLIGSVHELHPRGVDCKVDDGLDLQEKAIAECYGGDPYAFAEDYFAHVARLSPCDIIGHLDLITKYQEQKKLYDETHPRYRAAAAEAVRALLPMGALFEVNTGAMSRGVRTTPYPSPWLLQYIREQGGEVILSGDCHDKNSMGYGFDLAVSLIRAAGFERVVTLTANGREYIKF